MPESRRPDRPDLERGSHLRSRTKRRGAENRPDESTGVLCANLRETWSWIGKRPADPHPHRSKPRRLRRDTRWPPGAALDARFRARRIARPSRVHRGLRRGADGPHHLRAGARGTELAVARQACLRPHLATAPRRDSARGDRRGCRSGRAVRADARRGLRRRCPSGGRPRTINAFQTLGVLDRLEVIVLPILLGEGLPLSAPGTPPLPLQLETQRSFPDGSVELAYSFTS